ncbi:MAG: hypothetical protein GX147_07045 [Deltaproteobacteria bacterium]|nr:hypothetical protein [Deltaproteobacteria bacterium]
MQSCPRIPILFLSIGGFTAKNYDGYTGRNPKSGKSVTVKPNILPFFKVGKELGERVDGWVAKMLPQKMIAKMHFTLTCKRSCAGKPARVPDSGVAVYLFSQGGT